MKGIREEYRLAKKALLSEQSAKNYKALISVCYEIVVYYRELCQESEFAATLQLYEKVALSFWKRYQTAESLSHVVYFYGDWKILNYFNWLPDRKQHLLKGLKYARKYHDMEDSDYSACRYIHYFFSLCETCRSGEWKEQMSYAKMAYNLAKQYLKKYRTEQMLDEYKFAVMAYACYCRDGGREELAAGAERECERLTAAIKKGLFQSGRMEQEGNVLPFLSEKIVKRAVRNADGVMKSRRAEVNAALDAVVFMREKSLAKGILSLEEAIEEMKVRKVPCMEVLSGQIMIMMDLGDVDLLSEIMTNEYLVRQPDDFEALILYIYMLALIVIQLKSRYECIRYRESAWRDLVRIRNEYIRFLPEECKKVF